MGSAVSNVFLRRKDRDVDRCRGVPSDRVTEVLGAGWDTIRRVRGNLDSWPGAGDKAPPDPGDFRFDEEVVGGESLSSKPNARPVALAARVDRAHN